MSERQELGAGESWVGVDFWDELEAGRMRTFKHAGKQLVIGRTADGCAFALENRCPHEGYPLATGTLDGDALTCAWHNWKFDVRDGSCTIGGESVRRFETRENGGGLEVDLSDPDPAEVVPGYLASLREGLFENDIGRALRDTVRLLEAGFDPWNILAEIAAYDAEHAEYGSTHALALAAECGKALKRGGSMHAAEFIAPAIDMCGDANQRMPRRAQPDPIGGATLESIRAAVEAEDAARAEALLLGAFEENVARATIEHWLFTAISDHFLDFGHSLIYLIKAQELLELADDSYARRIYPGLLYRIVLGTREDTLPYMDGYARRVREIENQFGGLWSAKGTDAEFDAVALRNAVLDGGSIQEAFDAVWKPLARGANPGEIAKALVAAGAERLWRFDVALDSDPTVMENWLFATHRFTFASAVRNALQRFDSPAALRFLFQAVAFIHSGRRMDREGSGLDSVSQEPATASDIVSAVSARDADAAIARTLGFLAGGGSTAELLGAVQELCFDDPAVRAIVVAHAIKTAFAGFEEFEALEGHPEREIVLLAAVRFLASPRVERRVREVAQRSVRWVADGEMPKKLTQ